MTRRTLAASIIGIFLVTISVIVLNFCWQYFDQSGPLEQPTTIIIAKGQSLPQISQQLAQHQIITHPLLFSWHVRWQGLAANLQAGEYQFPTHASPAKILNILVAGITIKYALSIPEGMTTKEIREKIINTTRLQGELNLEYAEGELLPETYFYSRADDRNKLFQRLKQAMQDTLNELWQSRSPSCQLSSPRQAVILASIVEKETAVAAERPRIAAVFLNRLQKEMKLQADPTIIYGIKQDNPLFDQPLTQNDLTNTTPYNTYLYAGLPPTPICNPGRDSLIAVLQPIKSDELYFVADGTGGHVFSKTYGEHQQHHQNWRRIRKLK